MTGSPSESLRHSPLLRPNSAARSGSEWIEQKPLRVGLALQNSPNFVRALHLLTLIRPPQKSRFAKSEFGSHSIGAARNHLPFHLPLPLPYMY